MNLTIIQFNTVNLLVPRSEELLDVRASKLFPFPYFINFLSIFYCTYKNNMKNTIQAYFQETGKWIIAIIHQYYFIFTPMPSFTLLNVDKNVIWVVLY